MLTAARRSTCFAGRREENTRVRDLKARENDSVIVVDNNYAALKNEVVGGSN